MPLLESMLLEGPISTEVSKKHSATLIRITACKYPKRIQYTKEIETTVDIHRKNTVNKKRILSFKKSTRKKDSGGVI